MIFPWTERLLHIAYAGYNGVKCLDGGIVLMPTGLFQIGGDLESERKNYPRGIGIAKILANKTEDPFSIVPSSREYLQTLVPEPLEDHMRDLRDNPIYLDMNRKRILLIDPQKRKGVNLWTPFDGVNEDIDNLQAETPSVKLRNVRFDVEAKGYSPVRYMVREYTSKSD